nr:hypothetical protein [Tanacetum cinerariifolium]
MTVEDFFCGVIKKMVGSIVCCTLNSPVLSPIPPEGVKVPASPAIVEPLRIELPFLEDQFQEDHPEDPPEFLMVDNRTMAELLQAPTEVVAKVSTSSSTPAVSSEVFKLKDLVRALLLDKKNQSSAPAQSSTPAPVKA